MVTDLIVGIEFRKIILVHFDPHVFFFMQNFDHIWPAILYHAQSCAGQCAHDSKCLNEIYKAYMINNCLEVFRKFLVKTNWAKIRQILEGQYCPPPPDLTLIWKLGPDRVKDSLLESHQEPLQQQHLPHHILWVELLPPERSRFHSLPVYIQQFLLDKCI